MTWTYGASLFWLLNAKGASHFTDFQPSCLPNSASFKMQHMMFIAQPIKNIFCRRVKKVKHKKLDDSDDKKEAVKSLVDYTIETPDSAPRANVELVTNAYHAGLGFASDDGSSPHLSRGRVQNASKYPVSFIKGETVTQKLPELIPKNATQKSELYPKPEQVLERQSPGPEEREIGPSLPPDLGQSRSSPVPDVEDKELRENSQMPTLPHVEKKLKKVAEDSSSESDVEAEDFDIDDIDRQLELALEKKVRPISGSVTQCSNL